MSRSRPWKTSATSAASLLRPTSWRLHSTATTTPWGSLALEGGLEAGRGGVGATSSTLLAPIAPPVWDT